MHKHVPFIQLESEYALFAVCLLIFLHDNPYFTAKMLVCLPNSLNAHFKMDLRYSQLLCLSLLYKGIP